MAAATISDLNGLYKQVYPEGIENAVPGAAHLLKKIKFTPKELQNGLFYNQPIILAQEQGWSYLQAGGSTNLGGSVNMALQNAQVLGNIIVGQSQLSYEAAFRAKSKGPSAFRDAIGLQMEVMMDSGKKRQEMNFLYGQTAVALVGSNTAVNATATTLNIVGSEWAAGFWAGMQNARFDVYEPNGTQLNTTASVNVVVSNAAANTVTFTGAAADITAINNYANSSGGFANTANAAQLFFYGAYGNESPGLKAQLTNSGSLFGINAASYDLWKGTTYNNGGAPLHFANVQSAIASAVARGLDEEVDVYVNPQTWADLLTDQAALRRYMSPGTEYKVGADTLTFYGQNGLVNICAHIYVKAGDAFVLPMSRIKRIGAQEMTFNIPGTDKGTVFLQLSSAAGFEYRCYAQETIFVETPARCVYINGIVN